MLLLKYDSDTYRDKVRHVVFARKFRDWPRKYGHFGLISWWIKLQRSVSNDPRMNVFKERNVIVRLKMWSLCLGLELGLGSQRFDYILLVLFRR